MAESNQSYASVLARIHDYENTYKVEKSEKERPAPVRVEDIFDRFVKSFGGQKISDLIQDKSRMPLNADYIFSEYNVIAELKALEGVFSGIDGAKSLNQLFIDTGYNSDTFKSVLLGNQQMPEPVQIRMMKRIRRSLEKRILKARKQLRISKASFGNEDTKSLLIVAMDQPPLIGQSNILINLAQLMGDNYSDEHIDGVIYINPNVPVRIRDDGMEFGGWFPFYRDDDTNDGLSDFVNLLGDQWLNFLARETGNTNPILKMEDPRSAFAVLNGQSIATPAILEKRG